MNLIRLLIAEGMTPRNRLLGSALVSGVSSTFVLAMVNVAAAEIAESGRDQVNWLLAGLFGLGLVLFIAAEVFLISRVCAGTETAVDSVRTRLLTGLCRADFEKVEGMGRAVFYESITQATQTLSQNSQYLAIGLRSVVLIAAILVYIAYISPTALILVLVFTLVGGVMFGIAGQRLNARYTDMMKEEARLFESITDLLDGFKEVRMSSARSRDLGKVFGAISQSATDIRIDVQVRAFQQFILGEVAVFFLLAAVVFVVPLYATSFHGDIVKVTMAVLYMTGPVGGLIQTLPLLSAAEAAAGRMLRLDEELAAMAEPEADPTAPSLPVEFQEISLRGIEYAYASDEGEPTFVLGPLDLTVRRAEVIFITGGNGSGKSTLIKLLTGLYRPHHGRIQVDSTAIGSDSRRAFQNMMAPVFSDYHLFPRLYGVPSIDPAMAQELIAWFEMEGTVRLIDDRFDRLDLSAGQRKRLALIAALLEKRPVLVIDEWAADQDPHFRRKFYREVLPALKARGMTIIAVTHDDAYFDVADRRFHLDEGRLSECSSEPGRGV
ncbi:MAG: cyclic peptide export ABC transporter [Rhodospirillales bacterium]|jgi:putative ATP-binding cassette transporter|nr:cyclic peptide export ABC transporter [Rhodospirillales bacterium]